MGTYRTETRTTEDEISSLRGRLDHGNEAERIEARIELAAVLAAGRPAEAVEEATAALAAAEAAGLEPLIASAHRCLGFAHWSLSDFDPALEHAEAARRGFGKLGDDAGAGRACLLSGIVHFRRGSQDQAMVDSLEGRRLAEIGGDRQGEAIAANQISVLLAQQGRHAEALEERLTSARLHEALGDRYRLAMARVNIGSTYLELDQHDRALGELEGGIALLERIEPDGFPLADALSILSKAHRRRDDRGRAREALERGLSIHRGTGASESIVRALCELGELELECGDLEAARRHLEEGLTRVKGKGRPAEECGLCELLARLHKAKGDFEAALDWAERAARWSRAAAEEEQRRRVAEIEHDHANRLRESEAEIYRLRYVELERESERRRIAERSFLQSQKLESLGLLSGSLSHDFNNILAGVTGYASLANELLPPEHPARRYTDLVRATAERGSDLVRTMLSYAGEQKTERSPTDLNHILREDEPLFRSALGQDHELRLHLEEPGPILDANAAQLHQLLLNLILNAAEAGGRTVSIRTGTRDLQTDEDEFQVHTGTPLAPGTYARLEVEDDGEGMGSAVLEHLFDPFYSTKVVGRGLGMAAVLGIVRNHGGGVAVRSALGRGTHFEFLFPRPPSMADPRRGSSAGEASTHGDGRRLLLVDDDPLVREVTARLLEASNYRVRSTEGGREALEILTEPDAPFDVILLDLGMPEMDGLETLERLRARGVETPVLFTSGQGEEQLQATLPGDTPFLKKPFDRRRLVEALGGLLAPT